MVELLGRTPRETCCWSPRQQRLKCDYLAVVYDYLKTKFHLLQICHPAGVQFWNPYRFVLLCVLWNKTLVQGDVTTCPVSYSRLVLITIALAKVIANSNMGSGVSGMGSFSLSLSLPHSNLGRSFQAGLFATILRYSHLVNRFAAQGFPLLFIP